MSNPIELTSSQRGAILELGRRGSGGEFDETVLSDLFSLGLIEVRSQDRTVRLTERGQRLFQNLVGRQKAP